MTEQCNTTCFMLSRAGTKEGEGNENKLELAKELLRQTQEQFTKLKLKVFRLKYYEWIMVSIIKSSNSSGHLQVS